MQARYVRMYNDAEGASHFEDLSLDLVEQDFGPPAEPAMVGEFHAVARTLVFGAGPQWRGDVPHPTPQRQIFCVMRGVVEVTVSDGERRRFGPGDLIVLDDTRGNGHSSRVVSSEDLLLFGSVLADQEPHDGPFPGGPGTA